MKSPAGSGAFLLAQFDGFIVEAYDCWSSRAPADLF